MNRRRSFIVAVIVLMALSWGVAAGEQPDDRPMVLFGMGGSLAGLFHPDLDEFDGFLSANGYAPLGDILYTTGGTGRAGVLHGPSIGGVGWTGFASSRQGGRAAILSAGLGGIQLGAVAGGDERSLLTLGVVLGGGWSSLTLYESLPEDPWPGWGCHGIVPEPTPIVFDRSFIVAAPHVSMHVQVLPWMGIDVQLGYVFPILGFELNAGDPSVAPPSLDLRGPFLSVAFTVGGIAEFIPGYPHSETLEKTIDFSGDAIVLENGAGSITVVGGNGSAVQTASLRAVSLVAVQRAKTERALGALAVNVENTGYGLRIRTDMEEGSLDALVDYTLRIPAGVSLHVEQGAGEVSVTDHSGPLSIELGVGEARVERIVSTQLSLDIGVGSAVLVDVEGKSVEVDVRTGAIAVALQPDASYTVHAAAEIGTIEIGSITGDTSSQHRLASQRVDATIGAGAGRLTLEVGIGDIVVDRIGE